MRRLSSLDREQLIGVAMAQAEAIERLGATVTALKAEVAELRAKLGRPPKTPDNSSLPPSHGHKKAVEFVKDRKKKNPHPGAHRPLPRTRRRGVTCWRAYAGAAGPACRRARKSPTRSTTGSSYRRLRPRLRG